MHRSFQRDFDALADVFSFLDGFARETPMTAADRFAVNMAVEELFTNMVKYNSGGSGNIGIELRSEGGSVQVTLVDPDSDPFDVTADQGVDEAAELGERAIGGLGLHLVQRMMDEIHYDHQQRRTEIRLVKHLS